MGVWPSNDRTANNVKKLTQTLRSEISTETEKSLVRGGEQTTFSSRQCTTTLIFFYLFDFGLCAMTMFRLPQMGRQEVCVLQEVTVL